MQGLMMQEALTITSLMRHAEAQHPDREIVSVTHDNPRHRYRYADAFARVRRLAGALDRLGLNDFDRVATLAWNDYRHFELYYASSCAGYVCHTINPRLFTEQISYIVNHAEDRCLFLDPMLVPLVEQLAPTFESVRHYVILSDAEHMPETTLPDPLCYEALIEAEDDAYEWPDLDENAASSLCYTSGTTGNPKGVLYSHRSNVLHSYASALPDCINLCNRDVVLPVVPMFHANAWGLNYSIPMVGAKYVLPGPAAGTPEVLVDLLQSEEVTLAAGVPTVWLGLLQHLEQTGVTLDTLERTVVGGAACPQSIMDEFRERHGVATFHAWGMTEMSPLGTLSAPKAGWAKLDEADRQAIRVKQGRPPYGVELRIVDDDGNELPWDGSASGRLMVRGPWIASGYFKRDSGKRDVSEEDPVHGWFDTGDVACIDAEGYMQITDRAKDVIKSGGEWISSIDVENVAVAHPQIAEAAVIGVPHPRWSERPLLIVVLKKDAEIGGQEILDFMRGKIARWWIPDDVVFVDEIPHTATGKISKLQLREQFADHRLPTDGAGDSGPQ